MIARTWRGSTRAEDADAYLEYLQDTGFTAYRSTPGNRGVLALRQVDGGLAKFLVISLWESMDAIRAFAGESFERAVFYPEDDRFLVDRELHAEHHDVVFRSP